MRERVVDNGGGSASLGTNGARVLSDFELRISVCAMAKSLWNLLFLTRQKTGVCPTATSLEVFFVKKLLEMYGKFTSWHDRHPTM